MKEIWKDVLEFKGIYQVSNIGRVRSLDRDVKAKTGRIKHTRGKILAISHFPNGYCYVNFCVKGIGTSQILHRLVAKAFIPNPNNKAEVNHKDEDINNNIIDNLEWLTSKENANYGTRNKRVSEKLSIKVVQLTKNLELIRIYDSCTKAGNTIGVGEECVIRVCKGKQHTSKGYKWMYYANYMKLNEITRREVAV